MRIYTVTADHNKFDACDIDRDACRIEHDIPDWDMAFDFNGSKQKDKWWPRIVKRYNDLPLGDYVSNLNGSVMVLEKKAIEKLEPIMGNIEVLPLICDFGDYRAINVLDVLECIDYETSEYKLLSDELRNGRPRIMYFDKYVFQPEKVEGYNLFKIIDRPKSAIFVDEVFVQEVEKHSITGFKFDLVWEG